MLGFVFRRKRSSGENGDSRERRSAGEGGNGGSVAFSSWGGKRSVAGGDPLNRVVRQADINNLRRLARSTSFSAWGGKKWDLNFTTIIIQTERAKRVCPWYCYLHLTFLHDIRSALGTVGRKGVVSFLSSYWEEKNHERTFDDLSPSQKLNIGYQWQPARQYISRKTWPIFAWQLKDLHFESHSNIITF